MSAILPAALTLTGCDQVKKLVGGKPSGQVVATVNGEEITRTELAAEMNGFSSKDPKVMKAAQQQALQQIIMRDLLAQNAKAQKLDKSPAYVMQVRRGEQTLLAQLFERKLAAAAAAPTREEAESFVAAHPSMFAQRRVLVVDQIAASPGGKLKPEQLQPLKTLEQVKGLLDSLSIPYREGATAMDTLTVDPRLMEQIDKLPPGEVFVIPQGGGVVLFNRISQTKSAPVTGDQAVNVAMNVLRNQKSQELIRNQLKNIRTSAESKIVYSSPDLKPPVPPAGGAAAPAAAAATPPAAPAAPADAAPAPPTK